MVVAIPEKKKLVAIVIVLLVTLYYLRMWQTMQNLEQASLVLDVGGESINCSHGLYPSWITETQVRVI